MTRNEPVLERNDQLPMQVYVCFDPVYFWCLLILWSTYITQIEFEIVWLIGKCIVWQQIKAYKYPKIEKLPKKLKLKKYNACKFIKFEIEKNINDEGRNLMVVAPGNWSKRPHIQNGHRYFGQNGHRSFTTLHQNGHRIIICQKDHAIPTGICNIYVCQYYKTRPRYKSYQILVFFSFMITELFLIRFYFCFTSQNLFYFLCSKWRVI